MVISITVGELLTGILIIAGIILLAALTSVALKIAAALKHVNDVLIKNENNIHNSLDQIPKILKNTEEITEKANQQMTHALGMVEDVEETVGYVTSTVKVLTEDVLLPITEILSVVSSLKEIFKGGRKKRFFGR